MNIDDINIIIKALYINIFSFLIFSKITDCLKIEFLEKVKSTIWIIFLTFIYYILRTLSDTLITFIILYFIQVIGLRLITKLKVSNVLIGNIIAVSLSYLLFIVAGLLEFFVQSMFNINNKVINVLLTGVIELLVLIGLSKLKRFKNGLDFLKGKNQNDYIDMIMLTISSVIILTYYLFGNYYGDKLTIHIFISLMALGIVMIIMIQKSLVICYKQNLLKKELEACKEEIELKDNEIKKLSNEKFEISKINHEFYNRQKALELNVRETLLNANMETAEELEALSRVEILTKEYSEAMKKIKGKTKLPKTDITEIDDMFNYMQTECINNNIDFDLKINGNIHYLINHYIPKNKLETMIGDHIRDAIIAINSSNNKNKSILVILGTKDNCYELCVYDTGIEFEIDTLLKLGLERTTTHKETGGSGIGFMTTFETMKECRASLIIEEKPISDNNYTKSVTIRFDGKNDYKIISYRAEKIKQKNKSGRIIVEKSNK